MKLHWLPFSPFARKVLIAAHERGIVERLEVIETKVTPPNPELMQHNPLNKVPTLLLDDGTALYDSLVICEYLDSIGSGPKLFPEGAARWDALRRHALGNGFADVLIAWRSEITQPPEMQSTERIDKHFLKTKRILEQLEREAQSERTSFDIGDITVGCALAYLQFRFPQFTPPESSALHTWYAAFAARPSVAATMS
jgi:glutathione S-transferase